MRDSIRQELEESEKTVSIYMLRFKYSAKKPQREMTSSSMETVNDLITILILFFVIPILLENS